MKRFLFGLALIVLLPFQAFGFGEIFKIETLLERSTAGISTLRSSTTILYEVQQQCGSLGPGGER